MGSLLTLADSLPDGVMVELVLTEVMQDTFCSKSAYTLINSLMIIWV